MSIRDQARQVELRRCGLRPNSDAAWMTTTTGFPSPTELDARTPVDRDRAIDVIRITALIGVVDRPHRDGHQRHPWWGAHLG